MSAANVIVLSAIVNVLASAVPDAKVNFLAIPPFCNKQISLILSLTGVLAKTSLLAVASKTSYVEVVIFVLEEATSFSEPLCAAYKSVLNKALVPDKLAATA